MTPLPQRRRASGFTLFELIIAVSILVMVGAVLASATGAAFGLKRSAENAVEATRDVNVAGDEFVREVRNAVQPNPNSAADAGLASGTTTTTELPAFLAGPFIGTVDSFSFYASGMLHNAPVPADVRYVEFGIAERKGVPVFLVRHKVNLLEDVETEPLEEILAINVDSVRFMYHDGTDWTDTWDSTTNGNLLPYAVAMELVLKPVRDGQPARIIRRFAPVQCAAPATQSSETTGGITG